MQPQKTVFISYRRTNGFNALAVYKALTERGYDVFIDYEKIDSGAFDQIIMGEINARAHFLVILTPSALKDCTNPKDWLRREIEYAIEIKRNIVPLMFDGFSFKKMKKYLPDKLVVLPQYNGLEIPLTFFDEAMERLHTRFLNKPLSMILHPTPPEDRAEVAQRQAAANAAPEPTEEQLTAEQYVERGLASYNEKDYAGAIRDYDEAIRLNSQYADAYYKRGDARDELKDYDEAIRDYDEAIRLNPQYAEAYHYRGITRSNQGDYEGAIRDYDEAIRLNPQDADAYYNRGSVRDDLKDYVGAIRDYNEAIRLNPQYADAYYNRGLARYNQKDYDGAIRDYDEAIRLNPQNAMAYNNRGVARYNQKDYEGAIQDYEAALRIDPNHQLAKDNLELARKAQRGK